MWQTAARNDEQTLKKKTGYDDDDHNEPLQLYKTYLTYEIKLHVEQIVNTLY
jgi:hypothetical protein